MKLDLEAIIEQSLALLNEEGLDGFNLRALAKRLHVQAPAIYWHVKNKEELFTLMANKIYQRAYLSVSNTDDWREWLLIFGRSIHKEFLAFRDGPKLCAIAAPAANAKETSESLAEPLVKLKIEKTTALSFQSAVIAYALGWSLYEQNEGYRNFLSELTTQGNGFEIGLKALVKGF